MKKEPNGPAPLIYRGGTRLGRKGGRVIDVWREVWDRMSPVEWKFVGDFEDIVARHNIDTRTLKMLLYDMAVAGHLETTTIRTRSTFIRQGAEQTGIYPRAHYRIKSYQDTKA